MKTGKFIKIEESKVFATPLKSIWIKTENNDEIKYNLESSSHTIWNQLEQLQPELSIQFWFEKQTTIIWQLATDKGVLIPYSELVIIKQESRSFKANAGLVFIVASLITLVIFILRCAFYYYRHRRK